MADVVYRDICREHDRLTPAIKEKNKELRYCPNKYGYGSSITPLWLPERRGFQTWQGSVRCLLLRHLPNGIEAQCAGSPPSLRASGNGGTKLFIKRIRLFC